ncbi:MAG: beta-N-acetylhexosaminidase [Bacteroidales bacterium]|nr:beta-N-acetylhexosaminidase [Bacteroidales bacterium]
MKILKSFVALCLMAMPAIVNAVEIVPAPVSKTESGAQVAVPANPVIYAPDAQFAALAKTYIEQISRPKSLKPGVYDILPDPTSKKITAHAALKRVVSDLAMPSFKVSKKVKGSFVRFVLDEALDMEEYNLDITPEKGVVIEGGSERALWWGLQSLTQILMQGTVENGNIVSIPAVSINDKPHFAYRGAMLDCCRHFFTVDQVKEWIDIIALHKINIFHWHLTEDQGWRIEIKQYPLLTKVGSVREETQVGKDRTVGNGDKTPYGGYYTQKQIKEIVAYAAARHIDIIPEIEMPGHSVAALTSYPWLGCVGEGYKVRTTWGISEDVLCVGKESTFEFLEKVLDEVCELFPYEYIHIGGDEAPRVRWKSCPDCQAKMKELGFETEAQLQFYLLQRIEKYLNAKGKKIIGWDEILEGGVTPSATVMSWRGAKGGIKAALQGNDVVMTPNSHFYLDYPQTKDPEANKEGYVPRHYLPLKTCYSFDPYDQLDEDAKAHIKGVQANTWCEYIRTFDHVQHMDLPRFAALAEVSWSEERDSYENFLARVAAALVPAYEYHGYVYAHYAFDGIE